VEIEEQRKEGPKEVGETKIPPLRGKKGGEINASEDTD